MYFDEVKPSPGAFENYLIAGLSVSEASLRRTLDRFSAVKAKHYKNLGIDLNVEVHAKFIYHGKADFKKKDLETRIQLLAELISLLQDDDVKLVYSWINVPNLYRAADGLDHCFMHFCERAHNTIERDGAGLMIGDLDQSSRNYLWSKFAEFRQDGTPWSFGKPLPRFVDTVHFVDSRVCEMVQLADVYAFYLSGSAGTRQGYPADRLKELCKEFNLYPTSYKVWPRN